MKKLNFLVLIFALMINMPAMAFSSDDERIDNYLSVLSVGSKKEKKTMLNRLQWSGLSDPRLFNEIESHVKAWESNIDSDGSNHDGVLPFYIRALGFSGNEKYRATIVKLYDNPHAANVRKYSKRALRDLGRFGNWNEQIKQSNVVVAGKPAEVATYMKMLSVDDVLVQRLAARAMYHEHQRDSDLLSLAANRLKSLYLQPGLSADAQDTAAWLCKALGQNKASEYRTLLTTVAEATPHEKIRKYAKKYAF